MTPTEIDNDKIDRRIKDKIRYEKRKNITNEINNLAQNNKLSKQQYLSQFNSKINGQLHEQDWVGPEMDIFHKKMADLKQFLLQNCN